MKHFDRLFNTIMEEVKSSKKQVIKESIANIEEYKQLISMCANIVKNAGEDAMETFIDNSVNYDSSDTIADDLYDHEITLEQWENSVKYGWIVDSLPYAIAYDDDEFENVTPEQMKQIEEFVYSDGNNFANYFYNKFLEGDTTNVDFCRQICEDLGVTDPDKESLMIDEYFENGGSIEESVKKPVSKRRVIKEHKVHRPAKRRVIKESAPVKRQVKKIRKD